MRLKFYEVDSEYIKYLKENGDDKIPNVEYKKHKKFFCGIVLTINNFNYEAARKLFQQPLFLYESCYDIVEILVD